MNMNPTKTQAISTLLKAKTHSDLAKLYTHEMEVQVLAGKDNGEMVKEIGFQGKEWRAFTDGFQTWKSFRIPYKANTDPEYTDKPINFSLEHHAEGIGMTGWNWVKRQSIWVAYDFDSIIGHSERHAKKLTDNELEEVTDQLKKIPFSTLRLSTSGKGLHLYIFLEPVPTSNHTEHAALARSILSMLSGMTGFDFTSKSDICGGNMWVWHRKMYTSHNITKDGISFGAQGQGLKLIKEGCILKDIPANWRDHAPVVSKLCKVTVPSFVSEIDTNDPDKVFTELSRQRPKVPLDESHKKLIMWLASNNARWWWDQDNWMLVTHTYHLKEAHSVLQFKGEYETTAQGSERGSDHNCFCFPIRNGGWAVRRYSLGVAEAETWEQDGKWTRCFYNRDIDLSTSSKLFDGVEHEKGGFIFRDAESAVKALSKVGVNFEQLPPWILGRTTIIKPVRGQNKITVTIEADEKKDDANKMKGWYIEKKLWKRVFRADLPAPPSGESKEDYNDLLRHISNEDGADAGWMLKREGIWCEEPLDHIKIVLRSMDNDPKSIDQILGNAIINSWKLVNRPFQPEYPGNREWNRDAARFIIAPSPDLENLSYPTWQKILENCGKGLDIDIKNHPWCIENGISNGADYLKLWLACMFKNPDKPTPYLGFWGPQDSGKSMFHEMLGLLFEGGTIGADAALTSKETFNGELLAAILCIVEETSMKGSNVAYRRIKDWVTSPYITIHPKNCTPYRAKNYTHWCIPKNTWIQTIKGPKQVKDLINKQVTIIKDGKAYETNGFFETGQKQLLKIETNEGYSLECTSEHLIQVSFSGLKVWIEAGKLTKNMEICLNYHKDFSWNGESNWDEGYILGWLYGDGSFRTNDPVLYFYEDRETFPLIQSISTDCNILDRKDNSITIAEKQLKNLCKKLDFNSKEDIKNLEDYSSDFYYGFISALIDTDGTIITSGKRVTIYQSDLTALKQIQRMLLRLGITSTIYKSREAKGAYQLSIMNKQNLETLLKYCPPKLPRKLNKLKEILTSWGRKAIEPKFIATVNSIKTTTIQETYDITVPEIHAFDANGMVIHNCQTANEQEDCPIFPGDTRITLIYVDVLPFDKMIPKDDLRIMLQKEAPDFLASVLAIQIPRPPGRLALPVIETQDKKLLESKNMPLLQQFMNDEINFCNGYSISSTEFHDKFMVWISEKVGDSERRNWTKNKISRELPTKFPRGRIGNTNEIGYGNMTFDRTAVPCRPLALKGVYLRAIDEDTKRSGSDLKVETTTV